MRRKFVIFYALDLKKEENGWSYFKRSKKFKTLKEAIDESEKLMKKNKEIDRISISEIKSRKIKLIAEKELAADIFNVEHYDSHQMYGQTKGIRTEIYKDKY